MNSISVTKKCFQTLKIEVNPVHSLLTIEDTESMPSVSKVCCQFTAAGSQRFKLGYNNQDFLAIVHCLFF